MVHNFDEQLAGVVAAAEWQGDRIVGGPPTAESAGVTAFDREAARRADNRSAF